MYASLADLYEAKAAYYEQELKKLRDEVERLHHTAAHPPAYLTPESYDMESGKEFAYDEVLSMVNKVLR